MSESEFLATYRERASAFPKPSVAVDLIIFTLNPSGLQILLIQRGEPPFEGAWALPGGFVRVGDAYEDQGESLEDAARRELAEETQLDLEDAWLEQVGAFGAPDRDPRMRIISIAYTALLNPTLAGAIRGGSDAKDAKWFPMHSLPDVAFDHADIVARAHDHLVRRLDQSAIAFELVPEAFTIGDLREAWAAVLQIPQDPGNFRRRFVRMVSDGIIEETTEFRRTPTKPARLYRFIGGNKPGESP